MLLIAEESKSETDYTSTVLELPKNGFSETGQIDAQPEIITSASEANMFKVGDRVAVIHLHRVGKERRREAIRIDTVEKVTAEQIQTNTAKFNAESGFQIGRFAPEYQIVPLTPEHENYADAHRRRGQLKSLPPSCSGYGFWRANDSVVARFPYL